MMGFPKREIVEMMRRQYKPGTRVELIHMDDIMAPPVGTIGKVIGVDDAGSIMISWSNGSSLSVVYGVDSCRIID